MANSDRIPMSNFKPGGFDVGAFGCFPASTSENQAKGIQAAIEKASAIGGAYVCISNPGRYTPSVPIDFSALSGVTLELQSGVILDVSDLLVAGVVGVGGSNISIKGDGEILCSSANVPTFSNVSGLEISARIVDEFGNVMVPVVSGSVYRLQGVVRAPTEFRGNSIMWLGDSHTQYGGYFRHPFMDYTRTHYLVETSPTNINAGGLFVRWMRFHPECPTGNGVLRYYAATDSFTWQANGDDEGDPVSASVGGFLVLESRRPNRTCYLACVNRFKPAANASDNVNVSGTRNMTRCHLDGFTGWTEMLMSCPFSDSINFGLGGAMATEMVGYMDQWRDVYTDITLIHAGTNDMQDLTSAIAAVDAVERMIVARMAIGSKPVCCSLFPRDSMTATQYGAVQYFNENLRLVCERYGVDLIDCWTWLADPLASDGSFFSSAYTSDGLHLSPQGSYLVASRAVVPTLKNLVQVVPYRRVGPGIAYDATLAPFANLLTNGQFAGTTGNKLTRTTGDAPTSWTINEFGGSVCAVVATAPQSGVPVARTDGYPGNWMQIALDNTGGVAGEYGSMYQASFVSGANYAVGDYLVAESDVQLTDPADVRLVIQAGGSTGKTMPVNSSAYIAALAGDTSFSCYVRSFPMRVETGDTNIQFNFNMFADADGTGTFSYAGAALHKTTVDS